MIEEAIEDQQAQTDNSGLGAELRRARERAGLGLEDLAIDSRIGYEHLVALEEERFDDLPPPTFTKGYISAYARAVELDPKPLIKAYMMKTGSEQWSAQKQTHDLEPLADENRRFLLIAAVLLAVIIAALIGWFVINNLMSASQESAEETTPSIEETIPPEELSPPSMTDSDQVEVLSEPVELLPVEEESGEGESATITEQIEARSEAEATEGESPTNPVEDNAEASAVVEGQSVDVAAAATDDPSAAETTADTQESDDAETAAEKPEQETAQLADDGKDRINITLSDDSWIEIYDAGKKKMLHGLFKQGTSKEAAGRAPFQVFLGNAPAVEIEFNGAVFETAPYTKRNKTARFALVR